LAPARASATGNPVALAMIDRAEAILTGELDSLAGLAEGFEAAGMPYQRDRTLELLR
jgi:hypothetical protein